MLNNPERLRLLFERYLNDTATEQEQYELMKLIDENEQDDFVKQLITEQLDHYDAGHLHVTGSLDKRRANELFQKILSEREPSNEPVLPRISKHTTWLKWTAAAAVLVIISIISYQFLRTTDINTAALETTREPYPYDVSPAKMNAVLTLSDGRRINLDLEGNGNIAQEGNTQISKENGQIKYEYAGGLTDVQFNTVATERGNQFMVVLPDQTKVWLNASSSITFPTAFTGNVRRVKVAGEAYFEVAKKQNMPFKVSFAGDGEIEVLGTHFNVNTYKDDGIIRTTLLEGSVRITKSRENTLLRPGQQAQIKENAAIRIAEVDTDEIMAWKNGFFNFKDADINAIMLQLSRWYDIEIRYEGQTGRQLFTGEIDRSLNLVSVLKILEKTKVHFRLEENRKLVILP